jgi:hypothetical protein
MTQDCPVVKVTRRRKVCNWIDHHPRLGWYVAVWAFLVSLESIIGYFELIVQAIP